MSRILAPALVFAVAQAALPVVSPVSQLFSASNVTDLNATGCVGTTYNYLLLVTQVWGLGLNARSRRSVHL